ncbi:alpha/beta hydrolase [Streptomyces sp. NPDC020755]|uniref:alpha/beta fold hydrolase n=1 Tax=Streptomyces sp. NPDC020755 TaxID=3154790 RepID=UPI0033E15C22
MADKPAIVLVHGSGGGAAHWAKVITELHRRGFGSLLAVENPLASLADEAERTRKMVRQIGGPVVLVGHSYGGAKPAAPSSGGTVDSVVLTPGPRLRCHRCTS